MVAREVLIADALAYYLEHHAIKLPSANVQLGAVERFLVFFGEMTVDTINHICVEKYIKWRRLQPGRNGNKSIGDATINRDLSVLIAALTYYKKKGLLDKVPFIEKLPEPEPKDLWLERGEVDALLHACESPHLTLFIQLALNTAGRKQAILDLTWDRVDQNISIIDLNDPAKKKTKKRRAIIPIADGFDKILWEARNKAVSSHVIEFRGKPVMDVKKAFMRTCKKAASTLRERAMRTQNKHKRDSLIASAEKLDKTTPHTLRHTSASWMAQKGVEMSVISKYLGHSVSKTTEIYMHFNPSHLRSGSEAISNSMEKEYVESHETKEPSKDNIVYLMENMTGMFKLNILDQKKKGSGFCEDLTSLCNKKINFGAGDEIRTHDPNLGKVMLYP